MAGLMDFLNSEEARMGIGLLGAAGPQTDPEKTGLGYALQSAVAASDNYKKQQLGNLLAQSQAAENFGQAGARQSTAQLAARKAAALANPFKPDGTVDVQGLLGAGVPMEEIQKIGLAGNVGLNPVRNYEETTGPDGLPIKVGLDEFGRQSGPTLRQWKAPMEIGQGDRKTLYSPGTNSVINQFGVNVSPDAVLASDTTLRGQDMNAATARWKEQQESARAAMKEGKMTEDQGKVSSLLTEAERALANMQAVAVDPKTGKLTGAANAGLGDFVKGIPLVPGTQQLGQWITGKDREIFNTNMKRVSDVLLRAATGAGMNKDEARDAVAKYTPQFGESDELKAQKINDIPVFIEGLRARAGIHGAQAASAAQGAAPIVAAPGKPAIAAAPAQPFGSTPTSGVPQSKIVSLPGGGSASAVRAPNGVYYVKTPQGFQPVLD